MTAKPIKPSCKESAIWIAPYDRELKSRTPLEHWKERPDRHPALMPVRLETLVVAILNGDGQSLADAVDRFTRHVVRPTRNPSECNSHIHGILGVVEISGDRQAQEFFLCFVYDWVILSPCLM